MYYKGKTFKAPHTEPFPCLKLILNFESFLEKQHLTAAIRDANSSCISFTYSGRLSLEPKRAQLGTSLPNLRKASRAIDVTRQILQGATGHSRSLRCENSSKGTYSFEIWDFFIFLTQTQGNTMDMKHCYFSPAAL